MPPSAAHLVANFSGFFSLEGVQPRLDKLPDLLSPDINLVIAGKDSPLAVDTRGIAAVKSYMKLKSYKKIPLNPILLNSSVLII